MSGKHAQSPDRSRNASAGSAASMPRSLVEWGNRDEIDSRRSFVPGHEALTEIACEIVVGCLWIRPRNAANALCHSRFHPEAREFAQNRFHLVGRDEVI